MSRRGHALETLGRDDLVDVEEGVLLQADVDEGRLHPGQHVGDLAQVDVADDAALGSFDVEFDEFPVLEQGDPGLVAIVRDEHLADWFGHYGHSRHTGRAQTPSSVSIRVSVRVVCETAASSDAVRSASRMSSSGRRDPSGPMRTVSSTLHPSSPILDTHLFREAARQIENLVLALVLNAQRPRTDHAIQRRPHVLCR